MIWEALIQCSKTGLVKGTVSRDFLASGFFHESVSPQPQSIPLGPFRMFSKIRGDISKSRCTTGINYTGGKFAPRCQQHRQQNCCRYNDTGSKFCHKFGASVVDTDGKFATSVKKSKISVHVNRLSAVVGKHPDLMVGQPTSTEFPTNDRNFERSQFFEKIFEKI